MAKDHYVEVFPVFLGQLPDTALGIGHVGREHPWRKLQPSPAVVECIADDQDAFLAMQQGDMAGRMAGRVNDDETFRCLFAIDVELIGRDRQDVELRCQAQGCEKWAQREHCGLALVGVFQQSLFHRMASHHCAGGTLELGGAADVVNVAVCDEDTPYVVQGVSLGGQRIENGVNVGRETCIDQRETAAPFPYITMDAISDLVNLPQSGNNLVHRMVSILWRQPCCIGRMESVLPAQPRAQLAFDAA